MKRILLVVLFLCSVISTTTAQGISVASFKQLSNDLDARVNAPKIDQNSEKAALIKIVTKERDFTFDVGMLGIVDVVNKVGEIWVYVPRGIKFITINHQQLGVLRNYYFQENIAPATVYELVLTTGQVDVIVKADLGMQYFVLKYNPSTVLADLFIDDQLESSTDGSLSKQLNYGEHTYRISAAGYKSVAGVVNIGREKSVVEVNLEATTGYLNFTSQPESGATIYIDGEYAGITPFKSEKLAQGEHRVDAKMPLYFAQSQSVVVEPLNATVDVNLTLKPNFANVTLKCDPENEVYVNDERKGRGDVTLRLGAGLYAVEARRESHRSQKQRLEVKAGEDRTVSLTNPTPIYGGLDITSTPIDAEVIIDGKSMGVTPNYFSEVLVGEHTLELKKDRFEVLSEKITIKEGEIEKCSYELTARRNPPLTITTTPKDASIYIDNKSVGRSPYYIGEISRGEHTIMATKRKYTTAVQQITVDDSDAIECNIKMDKIMTQAIALNVSMASVNGENAAHYGLTYSRRVGKKSSWLYGNVMFSPTQGVEAARTESMSEAVCYIYTGETLSTRWSAILGYCRGLGFANLSLYGGVGFGSRKLYWEDVNGGYVEIDNVSGLCLDFGVKYGFAKRFALTAGVQMVGVTGGGRSSWLLDDYDEWYGGEFNISQMPGCYKELKFGVEYAF